MHAALDSQGKVIQRFDEILSDKASKVALMTGFEVKDN